MNALNFRVSKAFRRQHFFDPPEPLPAKGNSAATRKAPIALGQRFSMRWFLFSIIIPAVGGVLSRRRIYDRAGVVGAAGCGILG